MKIDLLQYYRVDRADGAAAQGAEMLAILTLKGLQGREQAYAISRADAVLIGHALINAGMEIQTEINKT